MTSAVREIRYAWRRLRRAPAFAVTATLTLALGIGATTAVFTVVNAVLLRPLPYERSEELVDLSHTLQLSGINQVRQSDALFLLYRRTSRSFSGMGAYTDAAVSLDSDGERGGTEAERATAGYMTADVLRVLRVSPLRGRNFLESEDRPKGPAVVLIGERLWKRRFAADPGIVGRRIAVDGVTREVVGVMREDFRFPVRDAEIWLPMALDPAKTEPASFNYSAVGRLAPNATPATAAAELTRILPRVVTEFPSMLSLSMLEQAHVRAIVTPLRDVIVGDIGRVLWVVLGTVGFVLLIACANVANLFLVRAEARQKELAVRAALGAERRELLAPARRGGRLLALAGGACRARARRARRATPSVVRQRHRHPPPRRGGRRRARACVHARRHRGRRDRLQPPADAARRDHAARDRAQGSRPFRDGRPRAASGAHGPRGVAGRARPAAARRIRPDGAQLRASARREPGFDATNVLTFRIATPDARYKTPADRYRLYDEVETALRSVPGVRSAGGTSWLPLSEAGHANGAIWVEDHPTPEGSVPPVHDQVNATPGYFTAMGIPLLAGRWFSTIDPARPPLEALVSRSFAQRYWKNESPIGKRLHAGPTDQWHTIVGVVGDVRIEGLDQEPPQTVYSPAIDTYDTVFYTPGAFTFVLRASGDATALTTAVRGVLRRLAPAVPIFSVQPMTAVVARASARTSFTLLMLGIASGAALLLGAVGIYGVISYMVSLRTREIGVRMALGAAPSEIGRMVSRQGLTMAATGVAIGLIAALLLTRYLRALLFEISPTDPLTLGGVSLALLVVALAASWLPARRAARVEPAVALRAE